MTTSRSQRMRSLRSEGTAQAAIERDLDVSRETIHDLERYADLLRRWTRKINLVAPAELDRLWRRHFVDAAALAPRVECVKSWVDLGSGGGLPAIPLALLAREWSAETRFSVVEADHRKAAFLRTASAELSLDLEVHAVRIENLEVSADVVSARALASVDRILGLLDASEISVERVILLKGRLATDELTSAARSWHMRLLQDEHPYSVDSYILEIEGTFRRARTDNTG